MHNWPRNEYTSFVYSSLAALNSVQISPNLQTEVKSGTYKVSGVGVCPFSSGEIAVLMVCRVKRYTNTQTQRLAECCYLTNTWTVDTPLFRTTDSFCGPNCVQTILNNLNLVTTHWPSARLFTVTAGITLKKCTISLFLAFSASVQQRL